MYKNTTHQHIIMQYLEFHLPQLHCCYTTDSSSCLSMSK